MTPTTPETEYAFWTEPDTSFTVTYSLGLFHEIDFHVNEGYRRIPHGGVETGGVLFGRLEPKSLRIEAFRTIECEHASGPSFVLSVRDLARLEEQLAAAKSDPELTGLEPVGWFIAHTRSELRMNDRESVLFDQLFPDPGQITVLVKPERFQPTRFGFLARGRDGSVPREATQHAIILPLPGRATRSSEGPVPSIPAPEPRSAAPAAAPKRAERVAEPDAPRREPDAQPPDETVTEHAPEHAPEQQQQPIPAAEPPATVKEPEPEEVKSLVPFSPANALPSIDEIRRRRSEKLQAAEGAPQYAYEIPEEGRHASLRLALVLFLAAALGCAVGYWAYLQLPAATIALNIETDRSALLVSWPPEQTRDAVYAAIRVDDGQQMPLTPEQRSTGEAKITPTTRDNVKVELIAQHWMRDSRGIVRYVKPLPPVQATAVSPPQPR